MKDETYQAIFLSLAIISFFAMISYCNHNSMVAEIARIEKGCVFK